MSMPSAIMLPNSCMHTGMSEGPLVGKMEGCTQSVWGLVLAVWKFISPAALISRLVLWGMVLFHASSTRLADVSVLMLQEISVSLWAVAKLGFHPGRMLVEFGARIEEIEKEFVPQACSNTLWALAVLQVCTACLMRARRSALLIYDVVPDDTAQANGKNALQPPAGVSRRQ